MRLFRALVCAAALAPNYGCDPGFLRNLSATPSGSPIQSVESVLEPVAKRFEMERETGGYPGSLSYFRHVEGDHPHNLSLTVTPDPKIGAVRISINEWFVPRRYQQLGAPVQTAVTAALESNGYRVAAVK